MKALPFLAIVLILTSCSFISGDQDSSVAETRPDIVLIEAEYTLGQSGENPIFINSSRMTFYSSDSRALTESLLIQ